MKEIPVNICYIILSYIGCPYPMYHNSKILHKHFSKRYCHKCGEYIPIYNTHRHFSRQKLFKYKKKYEVFLKIDEYLHVSRTNYRITSYTPYDIIIVWQNTKSYYFSFKSCINNIKIKKLKQHRDIYFTDIGILSLSKFWIIHEWNFLYPHIKFILNDKQEYVIDTKCYKNIDFLWTPNLSNTIEGFTC